MKPTLRAKFLLIAATVGAALAIVAVSSLVSSELVATRLSAITRYHVPRLEIRPRLEREFDLLRRGFQDAVAAQDPELLTQTHTILERIRRVVANAGAAIDPADGHALREALDAYYSIALDVSRRIIAGEIGENLVADMDAMQTAQTQVATLITRATFLREDELDQAFLAVVAAQERGTRTLLVASIACVLITAFLSWWLGRGVLASVTRLTAGFARFGKGDFHAPIEVWGRDELRDIATSANEMASSLEILERERAHATWLESGLAEVSKHLRGELALEEVASRAIHILTRLLEVPLGALYYAHDASTLRLLAHHAHALDEGRVVPSFRFGEGLVGRAAEDEEPSVILAPPAGYLRVQSGLGEAEPVAIVLIPIRAENRTIGVIELASFKPWSEASTRLLLTVRETIAIALQVAHARHTMRELLTATQSQADMLSRQEEELRATNDELQSQQEELRQTNQELIHQTEELDAERRVVEVKNGQLEETRRVLEQKAIELQTVSAYKSQFLANMSHELRTPLNSMLLLSSLLAENQTGNLSSKQVEYCKTVHAAGTDLLALINQVLDLAKIEAGKQSLRLESVALDALVEQLRSAFEPLADDKRLKFLVARGAGVPDVIVTDRQRLGQVLNNLLSNAFKFTAEGEVTLTIERASRHTRFQSEGLDADTTLAFTVKDTGVGIDDAHRERIFEPFEQADLSTERRYGGTGLGLAIAREIAGLLGGELALTSAPGVGSTFVLYVPERGIAAAREAPSDRPRPQDVRVAPLASAPSPKVHADASLLIVEDDVAFAHVLADLVRALGVRCAVANDGQSGLRLAKSMQPSGIVLDLGLPDIDGFALMERLSADPETSGIPIHVVSALDATERARVIGAIGYLTKPASKADLVRAIEALVGVGRDRKIRVLVVEQDDATGASLMDALAKEKVEAKRVESLHEATQALASASFACIVLDLSLRDVAGLEFLNGLAEREDGHRPAIIVYTSRALSKEETQRLERYAEAVVLKQGASVERLLGEIKLFARKLASGAQRKPTMPPGAESRLRGRKVLLCDDDMRTVYALSAMLRSRGAEVLVADTGRVALDVLGASPDVHAVLMDIMMPEMDGYETMQAIRAQTRFASLPIIALTAKAMLGDEEKCIEAGASAYLPKPIDPPRLFVALDTLLEGRG